MNQSPSSRLISLDAFRGAIMALMVLVNDPGDGAHSYAPLQHAEWNGWTITDVVFPSFLWIIGVSITLSFQKRLESGVPRSQLLATAARRAAILFALGLFLYLYPHFDFSTMRILGVLQRLAIGYFIASTLYLYLSIRQQVIAIATVLIAYWLLMFYAPVPGVGAGHLDVEGNFSHYVDRLVLGVHNYAYTKTWDPEGIVSTLPSLATALFGVMAGYVLKLKRDLAERCTWLFFIGNLLIAAGLILDIWMPINKKLWSDSFALFMAGLDFVMFSIALWWIDGQGHQRFTKPFVIMGMNAIAVYMASELIDVTLSALDWREPIYNTVFAPLASPNNASLLYGLSYVGLMFLIAYLLYRKKWFLKV